MSVRLSLPQRNILVNYLGVVWMGGLSVLLVPVYLRLMGADQWGVLALCMTLQSVLTVVDAGIGQIMPRDVARRDPRQTYAVYTRAYVWVGLAVFALGQATCSWWLPRWVAPTGGFPAVPTLAVRLALCQFLFQFVNNASIGFWNGTEAQRTANTRQMAFATLKHATALSVLVGYRADVVAYLAAFASVSALECLWNRRSIRHEAHATPVTPVTFRDVLALYREAGLLVVGVVTGMLASQIDRIVLSRTVELRQFGYYAIAASLGLAAMQLQYPIMRAYLPRLARADATFQQPEYRSLRNAVAVFCVVPCVVAIACAPWLLRLWLRHTPDAVEAVLTPLRLILAAVALNAGYNVIYQRMLIASAGRYIVFVNAVCVTVAYAVVSLGVASLGIRAGGVAWVAASAAQCLLGLLWFNAERARTAR